MDSADETVETIAKQVEVYVYLAEAVPEEVSRTAAFLKKGDPRQARSRLVEEAREAVGVLDNRHAHPPHKTAMAARVLEQAGCSPMDADLLLELSQIAYWSLLASFRSPGGTKPEPLAAALVRGYTGRKSPEDLLDDLGRSPDARAAFALIGRLAAERRLPAELFARLDLAEMRTRPYLEGFFRGL